MRGSGGQQARCVGPLTFRRFQTPAYTQDHSRCEVVLVAKTNIDRLTFDWVLYDGAGVKLDNVIQTVKKLSAGDKMKDVILLKDGTARITTASRH